MRDALQQLRHALVGPVVPADDPNDPDRLQQRRQRLCDAAQMPTADCLSLERSSFSSTSLQATMSMQPMAGLRSGRQGAQQNSF
jgi:hypothetical protein